MRTVLERIGDDYGVTSTVAAIPVRSVRGGASSGANILRTARTSKGAVAYRELAAQLLKLRM
jgi:hypothetical protein